MNLKDFKTIIKEAVREAVREEVGILLLEQKKQSINEGLVHYDTQSLNFTTNEVDRIGLRASLKQKMDESFSNKNNVVVEQPVMGQPEVKKNPFAAFIQHSAQTMTPEEYSSLKRLD